MLQFEIYKYFELNSWINTFSRPILLIKRRGILKKKTFSEKSTVSRCGSLKGPKYFSRFWPNQLEIQNLEDEQRIFLP